MGREFSLELGLWPSSSVSEPNFQFSAIPSMMAMPFTLNQQQQIMVFYNGTLSLCDFTELQARAILWVASRERRSNNSRWTDPEWLSLLQMPKSGNGNGNASFPIKKSLQRFLQRRKARRIRSMSPYHKL
ncbi:Protein TIFY 5A, partial [Cucurbita argyrosperma subsp. argyrosperma]